MLRRLLLLPLLSPLLVTLLVAALNPAPAVSLRLLTWRSAPMPIGLWLAIAGGGGAALSASATALALRQGGQGRLRRRVHRQEVWDDAAASPPWGGGSAPGQEPPRADAAVPARAPGEPAPTLSVPYRVLHRPETAAAPTFRDRPPAPSQEQQAASPMDWGESEEEDW